MIQPIGYKALIEPLKEETTKGGLIVPESVNSRGRLSQGRIIALGKSRRVSVGDTVYFRKMASDLIDVDGKECFIVKTKDIFAKNE